MSRSIRDAVNSAFPARSAPPGLFAQDDNHKVHKALRTRPAWTHAPPPVLREGDFSDSDSFATVTLLVVGDESVGKSAFHRGLAHYPNTDHAPEIFARDCILKRFVYSDSLRRDGEEVVEEVKLRVLLGDNARLRNEICPRIQATSYYRGAHGIFVCFDVTQRKSFEHVLSNWMEEIDRSRNNSVVIVLVGLKTDLVKDRAVSTVEADELAKALGLLYFECSSALGEGLGVVFDAMVHAVMQDPSNRAELWHDHHLEHSVEDAPAGWLCCNDSSDFCCVC